METEIKRKTLLQKFAVAMRGAFILFQMELSIRIQAAVATVAIALAWYLHISRNEWLWIVAAIAMVLITEALNTAIEKLVDLVSPGYNELAGRVKDIAAGAVFLAASISIVIGAIVFIPYL